MWLCQHIGKLPITKLNILRTVSVLPFLEPLTSSQMSSLKFTIPSLLGLHTEVRRKFKIWRCIFQAQAALAQLEQIDCITISPTGLGKTLTFWIPLHFNNDGIIIIVTALNILGNKNVGELEKLDISAVNITGDSATDELFKVQSLFH